EPSSGSITTVISLSSNDRPLSSLSTPYPASLSTPTAAASAARSLWCSPALPPVRPQSGVVANADSMASAASVRTPSTTIGSTGVDAMRRDGSGAWGPGEERGRLGRPRSPSPGAVVAVIDVAGFVADLKDHAVDHGFHVHDERHFVETYSLRQAWEVDLHPEEACGGPLDLHLSLEVDPRTLLSFEDLVMTLPADEDTPVHFQLPL